MFVKAESIIHETQANNFNLVSDFHPHNIQLHYFVIDVFDSAQLQVVQDVIF